MKRALLTTAALVAVAVSVIVSLPARRIPLVSSWSDGTVPGIVHVHTNRSDGRSSPDDVAAAAARAGVKFLVFTDHGDGTRAPDPPAYRSGVLCLDGVEISTAGGHYVALDMGASPYPLGGEPRDVVEDVRRLGGFGIAAHPDSPKAELQWHDWSAPFDGMEMVNPDTSWRVLYGGGWRPRLRLLKALFTYPVRPGETIASLLTGSPELAARWDALTARRRVVALGGVDAHAKLEFRNVDPGDNRYSIPFPSYEAAFRTLSVRARLDQPLANDASADARQLVRAIRNGHLYTVVDGWALPPAFEFTATNRRGTAGQGDELTADGPVTLRIRSNAPSDFSTTVWRGGQAIAVDRHESEIALEMDEAPAVYRVEIRAPNRPGASAWILGNPIYVRDPGVVSGGLPARPSATDSAPLFNGRSASGWSLEQDATSLSALDVTPRVIGAELRFRYGLSGDPAPGPYAGIMVDTPQGLDRYDRVSFTVRAEHPMRISVQVRTERSDGAPERWQRSVYIDAEDREATVFFDTMTPVGATIASRVPAAAVRKLMFIVDRTNSKPASSGRIWLRDVKLLR